MNPEVAPEEGGLSREKSFDNFKINLLKTSLQHYDSLAQPPPQHEKDKYKGADQGTLKTLKMVRKAVSKWKKKTDVQLPINPAVMSPSKSPSKRSGFSPTKSPTRARSRLSSESYSPTKGSRSRLQSESNSPRR